MYGHGWFDNPEMTDRNAPKYAVTPYSVFAGWFVRPCWQYVCIFPLSWSWVVYRLCRLGESDSRFVQRTKCRLPGFRSVSLSVQVKWEIRVILGVRKMSSQLPWQSQHFGPVLWIFIVCIVRVCIQRFFKFIVITSYRLTWPIRAEAGKKSGECSVVCWFILQD